MNKKLIFFVTEDWYFLSHRIELAIAAKKVGYDVLVVTNVSEHKKKIADLGVRCIDIPISRDSVSLLKEINILLKLRKIYKNERPDIVNHISVKPALYGTLVAWSLGGIKVVNTLTGLGYLFISRSFSAIFLKFLVVSFFKFLLNRPCCMTIVQNKDDKKYMLDNNIVKENKLALIKGSGVDTDYFSNCQKNKNNKVIVMLASRLLWDKGVGEFVDAAKLLKDKVNARFVLVGDNDPLNPRSIDSDVINKWNNTYVEWWGRMSNMKEVLCQSDIVCLPSYREGLPKVLLEAASCEKAIITTDVPGCREIVKHGYNGFLVPNKDYLKLAEAIEKLIEDKDLCKKMGKYGRKLVIKKFSNRIVIMQTLKLYKNIFL
jgi:glycosyltransferase involved in cell wall biosynthesis